MTDTGYPAFTATVDKTNRILKEIEAAYGWPSDRRNQSYAALRSVLHALRDRLPVAEAAQLAAQLPMLVRGLYYEGWDPNRVPVRMDRDELFDRVRAGFNYDLDGGIERVVTTVVGALRQHVTDGEWDDVLSSMPQDLAGVLTR